MIVDGKEIDVKWRFTRFYGSPYAQDRDDSWAVLKNLYNEEDIPWFIHGDFNEIMYSFEKKGGLPRDERRMEKFLNAIEECQLNDVGFTGNWFTWERGNLPETNIQERLDRGLANEKWLLMFPEAKIQHLSQEGRKKGRREIALGLKLGGHWRILLWMKYKNYREWQQRISCKSCNL
ncbi:hypothetical protein J1N35_003181 [Gossypium stocksii]|uniref:Endonuclease/exonuclease/phosphatase domain-containing protein n=1 Tax=Gossypium stocksii TaxID=47602 RepID=A0A9D3WPD2_9ROSI|nr:hypothetical protein J1N35_003181 [Gossypium stocksii]